MLGQPQAPRRARVTRPGPTARVLSIPTQTLLLPSNQASSAALFHKVSAGRTRDGEGCRYQASPGLLSRPNGHLKEGNRLGMFSISTEFHRNFSEGILAVRSCGLEEVEGPLSPLSSSTHRPKAVAKWWVSM